MKSPPDRKTRLAGALDADARDTLVRRMAMHVAGAARAASGIDEVRFLVVTAHGLDPAVALLLESGHGLNPALREAVAEAGAAGATRIAFIAGDLPRLAPAEVALLAGAGADALVIAPDRHGTGTNALSLPLPRAADFRFAFGPDSLARHREEAERLGLDLIEVRSEGLARDIDVPGDLADAADLHQP